MSTQLSNSVLNFKEEAEKKENALTEVSQSRAVAEVQASFVIAKKFPRDENAAYAKIMRACERPSLAEQSLYAYPRGGQMITGPSIRLAEALSMSWGNIECGVREISQQNGSSVAESFAIDLETNVRVTKTFHVEHCRDTKQGKKRLTDGRDIYELVANQGARRLRACILGIIPGDVVEAAVERCKKTMESSEVPLEDQIRNLVVAFDAFGIKTEHLEKRLMHKLESTIPAEIVSLRSVYKSIKDGMAGREQFFDLASSTAVSAREELLATVGKLKKEVAAEVKEDKK